MIVVYTEKIDNEKKNRNISLNSLWKTHQEVWDEMRKK